MRDDESKDRATWAADSGALLEVCVDSAEGAAAAEQGGADRIELCADLRVGGLSPGAALTRRVRELVELPIFVMVRPVAGGFVPSTGVKLAMEEQIRAARDDGVQGVVLGVLGEDGLVDQRTLERLLSCADGLPMTFHRAFDQTPDALAALETLIEAGVQRVLSSGHASDVMSGIEELAELVRKAAGRIVVMPGGGVRASNAVELRRRTRARELHSSVSGLRAPRAEEVRELARALRSAD